MSNNPGLYNAALAGLAGGVQSRWPVSADENDYIPIRNELVPIAEAVDAAIPTQDYLTDAGKSLMLAITAAVMSQRWPTETVDATALAQAIATYWILLNGSLTPDPNQGCCYADILAYTDGAFDDMDGMNEALQDENNVQVCFPPGEYIIDGSGGTGLVCDVANMVLLFETGAVLILRNPPEFGSMLQLAADGIQIQGNPVIRYETATTVDHNAVDLNGDGCKCCDIRFEMNAHASNATLVRLSGDNCEANEILSTGIGRFYDLVSYSNDAGTAVLKPIAGPLRWVPVDDGSTRNYHALCYVQARNYVINGIYCETGGRDVIESIVHIDVPSNQGYIHNPQVYCLKNSWGVRVIDGAEFLEIYGGIFHQSSDGVGALAGSQGIELAEGSCKIFGTKVIGYDIGLRFSGSCDSCGLYGFVCANNKTANIQIDSGVWPVSALGWHGGYAESEAVTTCIPIHFKSGFCYGMALTAVQLSSSDAAVAAIECDAGFGGGHVQLDGCRFPQVPGASVTRPNANTFFLFGYYDTSGSNSLATGANAANATSIDALKNSSLSTKSLTISTTANAGDAIQGSWFDFFTANFGAGIGANTFVELDFSFPEVLDLTHYEVLGNVTGTLAANGSLVFTTYLHDAGFVRLRATNVTAVAVGAIAGTAWFTVTKVR